MRLRLEKNSLKYDQAFFGGLKESSFRSAMKIIPALKRLLPIRSVVDVGCGTGSWLKAFRENGVKDIFGIDGNQTGVLDIPTEQFLQMDISRPFQLKRRFDLAVCVEVAEHLPESRAESLVDNLTSMAPAVLFSAGIPGQGGNHHVNEQWPEYWAEKFGQRGFLALDYFRMKIWNDPDVMWWYSQNLIFYVRKGKVRKNKEMSKIPISNPPPRLIHPLGLTIMAHLRRIKMRLFERLGI